MEMVFLLLPWKCTKSAPFAETGWETQLPRRLQQCAPQLGLCAVENALSANGFTWTGPGRRRSPRPTVAMFAVEPAGRRYTRGVKCPLPSS